LSARRDGHVALDEKCEAAEHPLLGQTDFFSGKRANAIGELLVVSHLAIVVARRSERRGCRSPRLERLRGGQM
jgi:hypothetical protein